VRTKELDTKTPEDINTLNSVHKGNIFLH